MKIINIIPIRIFRNSLLGLFCIIIVSGCSDEFLEEVPLDFLTSENAFTDPEGIEAGITHLHRAVRDIWTRADGTNPHIMLGLGSDFAWYYYNTTNGPRMDYSTISSSDGLAALYWDQMYSIVKDANVVISRAENPEIQWDYESQKDEIVAEARFFRAYAYRILVQLFGGVPIVDFENTGILNNLKRASKAETYQFIIDDLLFAAEYLTDTEKQPGRVAKAAANHLLSEAYIATEQWQNAIDAATMVIDDPNYALMTSRFGTRADEPGDVYWDLFRIGNQNRTSGNTETIWAIQLEYETPGGGAGTGARGLTLERAWTPYISSLKDPDGKSGFVLDDLYGRGVGWCTPTDYLGHDIWDIDQDSVFDMDMRNSEYNIHRLERGQYIYSNPESAYFGTPMVPETAYTQPPASWFPSFMKNTTPNNHLNGVINTGRIWRDIYIMRLAETYLLRAEAYLGAGNTTLAAADINKVRARANAAPVAPGNVNISFILDERARELCMEEFRTLTLMRLGLQYERTRDLNPYSGKSIQPHHNLWPIPQGEIDLNTGAELEQNPGYE